MHFYFANLILLLIISFIMKLFSKKQNKTLLIVMFTQLFLILALRSPIVGIDTQGYLNLFYRTKMYSFWDFSFSRHEIGYLMLNKIFQFINNEQLFIALLAFVPLYLIFKFISEESKIPWLSVYLFVALGFYTNSFNLLRQIIAMSIILQSYKYLKENNFMKFSIIVLIAALFHSTAISFIIVYFVRNNSLKIRNLLLYFLIGTTSIILSRRILMFVLKVFSTIDYEIKSGGGYALLSVFILIAIVALLFKQNILKNDPNNIILYNIMFLTIIMQLLALEFALFTRVTSYFSLFLIIFIPEILNGIKEVQIRIIGVLVVVLLTAIQYYMTLSADLSGIVPYEFFFN